VIAVGHHGRHLAPQREIVVGFFPLTSIGLVLVQLGKLSCDINANSMWRADEFAPCLEPVLFAASELAGDLAVPKLIQGSF
jgi:hypothetical protein